MSEVGERRSLLFDKEIPTNSREIVLKGRVTVRDCLSSGNVSSPGFCS